MHSRRLVIIPLLVVLLAVLPSTSFFYSSESELPDDANNSAPVRNFETTDIQTGILDPVIIEHRGSSNGMTRSGSARTDVNPNPSSEAYLPVGAPNNYYSGMCAGGYFLVGSGGSADFSSPTGTISFWAKWNSNAPHGRFWGQHGDFETRWSGDELIIDWDTDTTLQGSKNNWIVDHWYFFAITWNQYTNSLAIYWGDETTAPVEDASTAGWSGSVVGLHTENNIMNSIGRVGAQVDGNIDDFRYYSSSRNIEDIQDDYLSTSTISDPDLATRYRFENDYTDDVGNLDLQIVGDCSISRDIPRMPDGWIGDQIKVTASDVRKLYAINGTFESGSPGTNEDWTGDGLYYPDGWLARRNYTSVLGKQRASYTQDIDSYVFVENEGYYFGTDYRHYDNTTIYWYQDVDNTEENQLFRFSLDYNYMRGPIGTNFEDIFHLRFEILSGLNLLWNWSIDLTNVTQRQNWFNTGQILVNITEAPSSFRAQVVLSVDTPSTYIAISETDSDLDGDSTNGQFITVYLNNLELKSADTLNCQQVDLAVATVNTGDINLSGLGVTLLNYTSWADPIIPIHFSSNTSIVFDYSIYFSKMHRLYNSSFTTNLANIGASYTVDFGTSVNITFYTYVQSSPEAKDLGFIIYCPRDWENATVEDPFGESVVISHSDFILVPSGSVDSVGWWKIKIQSYNYAKSISTQVYDEMIWCDDTSFLNGDLLRCSVSIGTETSSVLSVGNLEIIWYLPEDSIWSSELVSNASGSLVSSNNWTLTSTNETAGEWCVTAMWSNGTEVAFGLVTFEVFHQLHIVPELTHIEAELDEVFTVAIYLLDQDNETPITFGAYVIGNWSTGDIPFSPNLAKGWWEADINTTSIGVGNFFLTINATMPYHLKTSSTITLRITTVTVMTILDNQYIEIEPDESYELDVRYMFLDGTGIEDADIIVLSYSGPPDGLLFSSGVPIVGQSGNYTIEITARFSGTYFVTLTASKDYVNTAATSFYIIVGLVSTDVGVSGYTPPEVLYYNQTTTISLFYYYNADIGIEGATVNVTYNPVSIIEWSELENGYYSISVRVPAIGMYSVYLRLSKLGFDYADVSFVFNVVEVPTSLSITGMNDNYYEGRTYEFSIFYNSCLICGISDADLTPSVAIRDFFELSGSANGWYNFTITPLAGNWNVTIWLTKDGFEEQVYRFILNTEMIPIRLALSHQLNATYTKYSNSILALTILPLSGDTNLSIQGANISYVLTDVAGNQLISQGYFSESFGYFNANISVPDIGLYLLRITILKEHHLTLIQDIVLSSINRPEFVYTSYFQAGLIGALLLFLCFSSVLISRRFYNSVTTKRNLKLSELKGRLEDAKNLIGLLIIQRKNGLPIFSRILKGGFQESLLSSFITAISNFREEISMDSAKWISIPISEVITAVQTEELICVIITVETASNRQRTQLEIFSREIGGLYDHDDMFVSPVIRKLNSEEMNPFHESFDSHFDGAMFSKYVGVKKYLPKHLRAISRVFKTESINHGVTIETMIRALIGQGINERVAYNIVMESLDGEYLIASEMKLPIPIEFDSETDF
ncbi:hypothetical protein EU528_06850 [Candidatus Thorarchaeota archaeon]|nr:MAG: hypothetical protein EU528_06850 [Candidatus Thorarchaeota archaeon]